MRPSPQHNGQEAPDAGRLTHTLVAFIHLEAKAAHEGPGNRGVVRSLERWGSCWVRTGVGVRVGVRVGPSIHWVCPGDAQVPAVLVHAHHVSSAGLRDGPAFVDIWKSTERVSFSGPGLY